MAAASSCRASSAMMCCACLSSSSAFVRRTCRWKDRTCASWNRPPAARPPISAAADLRGSLKVRAHRILFELPAASA
jgi:hypothetical protein